jgi:hypothetical protein
MGNGLSDLQKGLLFMAWKNFENGDPVSRRNILFDHHKRHWVSKMGEIELPHLTTLEALQGCTHPGARVSVSRAFKRLEDRGLVNRAYLQQWSGYTIWSGIDLTQKGKEIAKSLTVNAVRTSEGINQDKILNEKVRDENRV